MNIKQQIHFIKKKLWGYGYKVKDTSELIDCKYDLLVDEKIRVKIGNVKPKQFLKNQYDVFVLYTKDGVVQFINSEPTNISSSPYPSLSKPIKKK